MISDFLGPGLLCVFTDSEELVLACGAGAGSPGSDKPSQICTLALSLLCVSHPISALLTINPVLSAGSALSMVLLNLWLIPLLWVKS
jgi:hypothetical protein